MNKIFWILGLLGLLYISAEVRAQSVTQCLANASAGGTTDIITAGNLPCALSTNLLLLTNSQGPNTTTTPTLQITGQGGAQSIVRLDGSALVAGDLGPVNYVDVLIPTGLKWFLLNPYNSVTPSGLITSVVAGTGAACAVASTCHNGGGRISVGTSPGTTVVLVFSANFAHIPVCFSQDETSALTMRATTVSTSGVTFTASGTLNASDAISYSCTGI